MLLCYITDRRLLGDDEATRQNNLLARIESAAAAGIDFIQLREKDLTARELERLAEAMARVSGFTQSKLLINSRLDIALAVGTHGVHLRAEDFQASDARSIAAKAGKQIVIGVSCHSAKEVALAESHGADFALLGPIFEKRSGEVSAPLGFEELRRACARPAAAASRMPVLALGGVNLSNARDCILAGAEGVGGIRLFQESAVNETVNQLRRIQSGTDVPSRRHAYHPR